MQQNLNKFPLASYQVAIEHSIAGCNEIDPGTGALGIRPAGRLKTAASALEVYRRAYVARLTEALGDTYEAVWSVLGDDVFFD